MSSKDAWYFAYGSNLDAEQKEQRTGKIREARRCRAPGYRFAFNKRGSDGSAKANIVSSPGSETWAVVYRCSPEVLREMDVHEGVRGGHYVRHPVEVVTDDGPTLSAITYVAGSRFVIPEAAPRHEYLSRIIDGARAHQLPAAYIQAIEALGASAEMR